MRQSVNRIDLQLMTDSSVCDELSPRNMLLVQVLFSHTHDVKCTFVVWSLMVRLHCGGSEPGYCYRANDLAVHGILMPCSHGRAIF